MSVAQNLNNLGGNKFIKMNGAGNDFVIFDARKVLINLNAEQIKKISNRKNIGCDQLILIKTSQLEKVDALMEIYNSDGSKSSACGNATRCVAEILLSEKKSSEVSIQTQAGILKCWRSNDLISVNMGTARFEKDQSLFGYDFSCVDVGNPHAITFLEETISDEDFYETGPRVEIDEVFPNKTNVEFARVLSDNLIEVRVWERGSGETLACGSGACAVGVLAIKKNLVKYNKVIIRFQGGDLTIELNKDDDSIVMTGGFTKIFDGVIDEEFLR